MKFYENSGKKLKQKPKNNPKTPKTYEFVGFFATIERFFVATLKI